MGFIQIHACLTSARSNTHRNARHGPKNKNQNITQQPHHVIYIASFITCNNQTNFIICPTVYDCAI